MLFKISWVLLLVMLCGQQAQAATPPGKVQSQCLLALQAAGLKLIGLAGVDAQRCVSRVAKGSLKAGQLNTCLAAESRAVKKAKTKTMAAAKKQCAKIADFGPNDAQAINSAYTKAFDFTKLFGADYALTLKTHSVDRKIAACQVSLAEQMAALTRLEVQEYSRCSKQLVQKKLAKTSQDLEACALKGSALLKKANNQATVRLARHCASVPGSSEYPGQCSQVANTELGVCVAAQAHCQSMQAINAADRLQVSGHQYKEGVASYYCGTPPTNTSSVARQWNGQIIGAIRLDNPRPTVHARNLFHLSAAMYDAWVAYDGKASAYFTTESPIRTNPERDRDIAISFAAYRVLSQRYSEPLALGFSQSQAKFAAQMDALGLDKNYKQTNTDNPAAVGNRIAAAILGKTLKDGANEAENYQDLTYKPVNKPLVVKQAGIDSNIDPNRWQPLALDSIVSQNGIALPGNIQTFIGSQWGNVTPFALTKTTANALYLDQSPQPQLAGLGDAQFKDEVLELIRLSSQLTPDDGTLVDISPVSQGHNTLGTNDGQGYTLNPVTGQAYSPQVVKRGDFGRVLAEWWADGPTSETPPGHWNVIANRVADSPGFQRRIAGAGPVLGALEWDVKTYFALNAATHDAAIAAWGAKRKYDGSRPITMIRYMAKLGQSSDPNLPSYHVNGLPLVPGLVELISADSSAPGQKHADLTKPIVGGRIGDVAIMAWPGKPIDPKTQFSGVRWILGKAWLPYQRATFVTPAFPGYISGHSTFSRAAAEVLAAITGSEFFPGGLYEVAIPQDTYLIHEHGPSQPLTLQWASYFDASDQSGRSRLWGGIHVAADDIAGRLVGHQVGLNAYAKAVGYFNGSLK